MGGLEGPVPASRNTGRRLGAAAADELGTDLTSLRDELRCVGDRLDEQADTLGMDLSMLED